MIQTRNLLQLLSICIIFGVFTQLTKAENIVSPEQVYDLAFSNCSELNATLKAQSPKIPPFDKLKLAENLSKIITLRTPNNTQFPNTAPAPYSPKSFDVSLTLTPNSENKAKECAINNLSSLLPESIITIPSLISASKDTSLPRFLKVIMLEKARSLAQSLKEPMKDYSLSALLNEFKKNKLVFGEDALIPTLLPIIQQHRDFFRSLALEYQSQPLITALRILDPKGDIEAPALISELLSSNSSLTKVFILNAYSAYPEKTANLLDVLPEVLNNLTSSETGSLLDLISKFADRQLTFFPELVSDTTGESLLHLLSVASDKQKTSLAKAARELNLRANSTLCTEVAIEKGQSSLTLEQKIYRASLCSLNNSSTELLKVLNKQKNLENLTLSLVLTSKNSNLRRTYLSGAYKELEKLKSSIAPKERRDIAYYILSLENLNTNSTSKLTLTNLAEELISEEPSYPSLIGNIIINHGHPSIVYFSSLGKHSISPVSKMLKNKKSNILRKQGLTIASSDSYLTYPELFPLIENLIADSAIDIRRLAYQTLSKKAQKFPYAKRSKVNNNTFSQFYGARLKLQFATDSSTKETAVLDIFTSIAVLSCQEASVPLNYLLKENLLKLPPIVKERAEVHLMECLNEKGPFGKRSISTLELLSPLSEIAHKQLEQLLSKNNFPQLAAKEGIRYLNLLFADNKFPAELPQQIANNLFTNLSLKDQAMYADWLTLNPFEAKGIERLLSENFDSSIHLVATEFLNKDDGANRPEKEIREFINILDRHGQDIKILLKRLPENTKKELIELADSQSDQRLTLNVKSLLCPYLSVKDCNITIKPSLEYTLENPMSTLMEISILLNRNITDTNEDQLLLRSAVEYRLNALIQQGNIKTLINSKLSPGLSIILEDMASDTNNPTLTALANFIRYSMAPTEIVR